jgi:hypothetical protein
MRGFNPSRTFQKEELVRLDLLEREGWLTASMFPGLGVMIATTWIGDDILASK